MPTHATDHASSAGHPATIHAGWGGWLTHRVLTTPPTRWIPSTRRAAPAVSLARVIRPIIAIQVAAALYVIVSWEPVRAEIGRAAAWSVAWLPRGIAIWDESKAWSGFPSRGFIVPHAELWTHLRGTLYPQSACSPWQLLPFLPLLLLLAHIAASILTVVWLKLFTWPRLAAVADDSADAVRFRPLFWRTFTSPSWISILWPPLIVLSWSFWYELDTARVAGGHLDLSGPSLGRAGVSGILLGAFLAHCAVLARGARRRTLKLLLPASAKPAVCLCGYPADADTAHAAACPECAAPDPTAWRSAPPMPLLYSPLRRRLALTLILLVIAALYIFPYSLSLFNMLLPVGFVQKYMPY